VNQLELSFLKISFPTTLYPKETGNAQSETAVFFVRHDFIHFIWSSSLL